MRRWVFLPFLVIDVPVLVMFKGGDALSVCLNTVAILFLCDIDNIFFDLVLGERVRARVEDAGRVELGDAEATALARTKAVHVMLLVLAVPLSGVWSANIFNLRGDHPAVRRFPGRRRGGGVRAGRGRGGDGQARVQGGGGMVAGLLRFFHGGCDR